MLDPSLMNKILELRACWVRIRGLMPSNRAHAAIATHSNMNSTVSVRKTQNKHWFQGSSGRGAGGLVAVLPCTSYFGKLAMLFG